MSVPVFRRSENKLQAYKSTIEMTRYTMHMVENEKIFPKKSRWNIGSRITDNCLDSIIKIRQANKISVLLLIRRYIYALFLYKNQSGKKVKNEKQVA